MKFVARTTLLFWLPALAACLLLTAASADEPAVTRRTSLDADWRFQKGDPAGDAGTGLAYAKIKAALIASSASFPAEHKMAPPDPDTGKDVPCTQPGFADGNWRKLDLPHDWGIEGPFDQNVPGETGKLPWAGVGWYRKHFPTPAAFRSQPGRHCFLDIDGAMAYAAVWCNGRFVGGWPYGYASFRLDLTPFLHADGTENVLAIRLDNPPESSRWYPGGGIYRHVWLVDAPAVHLAHWGVTVTTPEVSAEKAIVRVRARIDNPGAARKAVVQTMFFLTYPLTSEVQSKSPEVSVTLAVSGQTDVVMEGVLPTPLLWDTDNPALYTAMTFVSIDGQRVDQRDTVFGVRTVKFTADNGLLLNGKRVPIRGVCGHHDLGALGTAFNLQALERQFALLKAMGCNAFRTSHNPPAPELLDLCDRLGILVMDESFDCWQTGKKDNDYHLLFDDWSEKDLRALVRRDRNHPSVILWSIGNEIPDQGTPQGPALAAKLTAIVHEEDPTRLTTTACDRIPSGYNDFRKGVDVFGYNYKPEEYRKFREKNPGQPLIGTETSSAYSSRGAYFFPLTYDRKGGLADNQVSSYDLYYDSWATGPDREFKGEDQAPFVAGEWFWTGLDYLGEPTPYNRPGAPARSSYFGAIDLAGFPKDRFYLYQSRWRPELPMAHLLPHWTWPGREGQVTPVHLYTSGDEAELFLNGQSLGRKKKGPLEYRLRWDDVKYAPGELKAVCYKNGKEWATQTVKTAGAAAKILLQAELSASSAARKDLFYVDTVIADANGNFAPSANALLRFSVSGPAELVATDNGDATNHTKFQSAERRAFNGRCLLILRAKTGETGPITVRAESAGLTAAELQVSAP